MIFNRGKACLGCVIALLLYASALYSQSSDPTATAVEALRQQLASLQTQMADVQNQLNKLSAHTTDLQSSRNPSPQQSSEKEELTEELNKQAKHQTGEAVAAYETYSQDPQAAPRVDNSPLDPNFPGYFRLPGTRS
jgi:peptidoglycan hydrolase CwlO-like protein